MIDETDNICSYVHSSWNLSILLEQSRSVGGALQKCLGLLQLHATVTGLVRNIAQASPMTGFPDRTNS